MKAKVFTLKNESGMTMKVSNLGGIVMSLTAPDREGKFKNVLLEFNKPEDYAREGYISSIIGRVGNRISGGKFTIDDKTYNVALNSGKVKSEKVHLHGGMEGFDKKIWDTRLFDTPEGPAIEFTRLSPNGEENYPGNLFVRVVYTLMNTNAWRIQYWAMTDAPTYVNLTQHAYFNLSGCEENVENHVIQLFADKFLEIDSKKLPTGKILPVCKTPLDLREARILGECFNTNSKHTKYTNGGIDHNYFINRTAPGLALAAVVEDPKSGRQMEAWTTEPCVQLYTGNFLSDERPVVGKNGKIYEKFYALCLETQHAPDSPNIPALPSIRLNPGEVYQSTTIYQFYAY